MNKRQKKKNDKKARLESEKAVADFKNHITKSLDSMVDGVLNQLDDSFKQLDENIEKFGKETVDTFKASYKEAVSPKKTKHWLKRLFKIK